MWRFAPVIANRLSQSQTVSQMTREPVHPKIQETAGTNLVHAQPVLEGLDWFDQREGTFILTRVQESNTIF